MPGQAFAAARLPAARTRRETCRLARFRGITPLLAAF
jgi:hypothetical protein